jgi:hypothetical protein
MAGHLANLTRSTRPTHGEPRHEVCERIAIGADTNKVLAHFRGKRGLAQAWRAGCMDVMKEGIIRSS